MSATSLVPAAVPSLWKSCLPSLGSVAGEVEHAADGGQVGGEDAAADGLMSLTIVVPAGGAVALPELVAVDAVAGGEEQGVADGGEVGGEDAAVTPLTSLPSVSRTVPATVPSVSQTWLPWVASVAVKKSSLPIATGADRVVTVARSSRDRRHEELALQVLDAGPHAGLRFRRLVVVVRPRGVVARRRRIRCENIGHLHWCGECQAVHPRRDDPRPMRGDLRPGELPQSPRIHRSSIKGTVTSDPVRGRDHVPRPEPATLRSGARPRAIERADSRRSRG